MVGILATGFTLFTLIVPGHDAALDHRPAGARRLSPIDEALSRQVVAVALQTGARGRGAHHRQLRIEAMTPCGPRPNASASGWTLR